MTAETEPAGTAIDRFLRARPTPLLRIAGGPGQGTVLAKLESLRPAGSVDDRGLACWEGFPPKGNRLVACLPSHAVLAGAGWARARGVSLRALVHGPITHEVSETLLLWGTDVTRFDARYAAEVQAQTLDHHGETVLPDLDGALAVAALRETLGHELAMQLKPAQLTAAILVAPAGAIAALAGCQGTLSPLRTIALCAASPADVLPELPERAEAEQLFRRIGARVELVPIARARAQSDRAQLARSHGLSASHAAAAAVAHARELVANDPGAVAIALVTATGEREFSLDPSGAGGPATPSPRA